ncbi:MAG: hypothetical protein ACYDAY_07995 [Candidatus Dormibacteria bacterium]
MSKRWLLVLPAAGAGLALLAGVAVVEAATPSPGKSSPAQTFLDKLAGILHLSSSQLQGDVMQARMATIDQMVKDGRITQAQGDAMKQRLQSGGGGPFGFGMGRPAGAALDPALMKSLRTAEMNAVATALGLTPDTLKTDLQSKTLADLEKSANVTDQAVRDAATAAAHTVLDPAVKAGTITQAQEDTLIKRLSNAPAGALFGGPRGGHRGWGGPGNHPAPGSTPSPQA